MAFIGADEISVASLDCCETKMEFLKDSQSQTNLSQLHSKGCAKLIKRYEKSDTDVTQTQNNRKVQLELIDQSLYSRYNSLKLNNNNNTMSNDTIIDSSQ